MNVPKSPITLLLESIKASERTKGVRVYFGARELPASDAPPRIVLVPTVAEYQPPEHNGNWIDSPLTLEAHCWGGTFDEARYLRDALVNAALDYQLTNDLLRVTLAGEAWDEVDDTNRQGWEVTVSISFRDTVAKVPLAANAGSATLDNEQFAPDGSTTGPTITQP